MAEPLHLPVFLPGYPSQISLSPSTEYPLANTLRAAIREEQERPEANWLCIFFKNLWRGEVAVLGCIDIA